MFNLKIQEVKPFIYQKYGTIQHLTVYWVKLVDF